MEKLQINHSVAQKMLDWLTNRGGVLVWQSHDLSDPGRSVTTPAMTAGVTTIAPGWQYGGTPRHITSMDDIEVCYDKVVKRLHVAIQHGSGLRMTLTPGASRKVRQLVAEAGEGAYHYFDYSSYHNCIIMAPEKVIPLRDWKPATEVQ